MGSTNSLDIECAAWSFFPGQVGPADDSMFCPLLESVHFYVCIHSEMFIEHLLDTKGCAEHHPN